MNSLLTLSLLALVIIILDFLWLGILAKNLYAQELGTLLKQKPHLYSAAAVYLLLTLGIYFFVLQNSYVTNHQTALLLGALFGLILYGVYEFTNLALIQGWTKKIVIIDILWGMTLGAITSVIGYTLLQTSP